MRGSLIKAGLAMAAMVLSALFRPGGATGLPAGPE